MVYCIKLASTVLTVSLDLQIYIKSKCLIVIETRLSIYFFRYNTLCYLPISNPIKARLAEFFLKQIKLGCSVDSS